MYIIILEEMCTLGSDHSTACVLDSPTIITCVEHVLTCAEHVLTCMEQPLTCVEHDTKCLTIDKM